jgi:PAS domain S-box-containing protein
MVLLPVMVVSSALADETVRVGILAVRPAAQVSVQWQPLIDHLNAVIPGRHFEGVVFGYDQLENAIGQHSLDFILTNPSHYILATRRNGLSSPLATLVPAAANSQALKKFGGVVITRPDRTDIHHLTDLKNKTVAAVSKESLGGYQAQAVELAELGLKMPEDVSLIETGIPYDNAVAAVLDHRADAGFVRTGVLEAMAWEGKLDLQQIKVIENRTSAGFPYLLSTELYPEWPFAAMPSVDEELAHQVVAALLSIPHDGPLARRLGIHGFTIPADYEPVRNALYLLRLPPFDVTPPFTLADIWQKYREQIIALLVIGTVVAILVGYLVVLTRRISRHKDELKIISDNTYDWEIWQAPDGHFIYVSPSCERITGYPANSFLSDPELLNRILDPRDVQRYADHLQGIEGKAQCETEFRIRTQSGETRWIAHGCRAVYDAKGNYMGRRASNRDVTAARAAELEYRTIVQTVQDGFLIVGKDTRFVDTNDAYCRMLGYPRDELLQMQVADVDPLEDPDEALRHAEEIHRIGHAQFETKHRRKDGSILDVAVTAQKMDLHGGVLVTFVRDISERKRAERATQVSEQRFRDLFDSSPDAVFIIENNHFVEGNPAAVAMFGYDSPESFLNVHPAELSPPTQPDGEDSTSKAERMISQAASQGIHRFEWMHRTRNGKNFMTEVTLSIFSLNDRPAIYAVLRDITERKQAEHLLALERQRLHDFSESSADWFWEMDADLRFTYFSDNFERVYGMPSAVLLGKKRSELMEKDNSYSQADVDAHIMLLERHEPFRDFECRMLDSAGSISWLSVSGVPCFDHAGSFAGYRGIGRVVTDRKTAEIQLRESKERLEVAASAGIVGIWDWDVVNDRLVWDKVMYQLYGLREDDFSGAYEAWSSALHPDDKIYTEREVQAALRGEREYAPEFRIVCPDGTIRYIKAQSRTTFDAQGNPQRMVGVNYDITEHKHIEFMLEEGIAKRTQELKTARDAAQAANVAKSAFLANMSHEMRTPLHQITGLAEVIQLKPLTPQQMGWMDTLVGSAHHLTAIIDTILEMTSIEAGQFDRVDEPFSPKELLDEVLVSVQAQVSAKQLYLSVTVGNVPARLVGAKSQLKQALLNYVVNAVRFCETGAVHIRLNLAADEGDFVLVRFEVEDSGPGIAPEDLPRLFNIFEQVDNSSTRKFGGLGVGLAMTKKIAELMGGEAGCESTPGVGSTFWFTARLRKA